MTRLRECWRCWFLQQKGRLWHDADWLYATASEYCSAHQPVAQPDKDLAAEYKDHALAAAKFEAAASGDAEELLVDAALRWQDDVDAIAATTREKAKTLVGAGSLAFTLLFAGMGFVSGGIGRLPRWALVTELALLAVIATHLIRALVTSIDVMTREELLRPSMQEYVRALGSKRPRPHIAAAIVTSANAYHERLLPRISRIIVAKTAFKWALVWMVPLMALQLLVASLYPEPSRTLGATAAGATPSVKYDERATIDHAPEPLSRTPAPTTRAPSVPSDSDTHATATRQGGTPDQNGPQQASPVKGTRRAAPLGGSREKHDPVQRKDNSVCPDARTDRD